MPSANKVNLRKTFLSRIAVSALVLFTLATDVAMLTRSVRKLSSDTGGGSEVSRLETRLHPLRAALPRLETVGYVDDAGTVLESDRGYTLAGYVLSPVLVERGAGRRLVIGVFSDPAASTCTWRAKGLSPVRDFGQGVVLFERNAK